MYNDLVAYINRALVVCTLSQRGLNFSIPDVSGEVMYSDTHRQRLVFDMETRIPENSEVTLAELKLFKTAPKKYPKPENKNRRPVNNARVSIYWVNILENGSNHTSLVDSR